MSSLFFLFGGVNVARTARKTIKPKIERQESIVKENTTVCDVISCSKNEISFLMNGYGVLFIGEFNISSDKVSVTHISEIGKPDFKILSVK